MCTVAGRGAFGLIGQVSIAFFEVYIYAAIPTSTGLARLKGTVGGADRTRCRIVIAWLSDLIAVITFLASGGVVISTDVDDITG